MLAFVSFVSFVIAPARAAADIIFFTTGRTLSVKAYDIRVDKVVLQMREGGEVVAPVALVAKIEADEVPYPEPAAPAALPLPVDMNQKAPSAPLALRPEQLRYRDVIDRVSAEQGVDPRIVHAVIEVESNYKETARSPKGARGLMQLMPETARRYAVTNLYDPVANIEAGVKHLKMLLVRYTQNLPLALAAYNAGEAAVDRFRGIPPFQETRSYVTRILKIVG